jgi:hypothetical protein
VTTSSELATTLVNHQRHVHVTFPDRGACQCAAALAVSSVCPRTRSRRSRHCSRVTTCSPMVATLGTTFSGNRPPEQQLAVELGDDASVQHNSRVGSDHLQIEDQHCCPRH